MQIKIGKVHIYFGSEALINRMYTMNNLQSAEQTKHLPVIPRKKCI